MTQKAVLAPVLAYDLGGTKVAVGVVTPKGKILEETRVPAVFAEGKEAVIKQLSDIGVSLLLKYPQIKHVGLASAGPLDPAKGTLLDPTNFGTKDKRWGKVPLAQLLSKKLKRHVILENDAAAAALAESWVGTTKNFKNSLVLTLGTGLGTGIIANGQLLRAGRGMHPEGGHMIIRHGDKTAVCGCGNLGCAEALLSGNGFGKRFAARMGDPRLDGKKAAEMARKKHPIALDAFAEYADLMAVAIHNFAQMFCPEIVVFTGSFAHAHDLFLKQVEKNLKVLLARSCNTVNLMPILKISKLENQAGILGGAFVAYNAQH